MLVDDDVFFCFERGSRSSLLSFRRCSFCCFRVMEVMNFLLKGGWKLLTHVCMQMSISTSVLLAKDDFSQQDNRAKEIISFKLNRQKVKLTFFDFRLKFQPLNDKKIQTLITNKQSLACFADIIASTFNSQRNFFPLKVMQTDCELIQDLIFIIIFLIFLLPLSFHLPFGINDRERERARKIQ